MVHHKKRSRWRSKIRFRKTPPPSPPSCRIARNKNMMPVVHLTRVDCSLMRVQCFDFPNFFDSMLMFMGGLRCVRNKLKKRMFNSWQNLFDKHISSLELTICRYKAFLQNCVSGQRVVVKNCFVRSASISNCSKCFFNAVRRKWIPTQFVPSTAGHFPHVAHT